MTLRAVNLMELYFTTGKGTSAERKSNPAEPLNSLPIRPCGGAQSARKARHI
jgi:hypothetical protein